MLQEDADHRVSRRRRMSCAPKEPSDAPPQKPLSRSCAHDLRQPCSSRPRRRGSFAVPRPSMRWSRATMSPPSPPPSTWRILPCANGCSALRRRGPRACVDRPRSGRPPKVTCELEQHLNRLVDQDPLQHGSLHSQWSCRELATVLAQQTGVQLGRESVRCVLKKRR